MCRATGSFLHLSHLELGVPRNRPPLFFPCGECRGFSSPNSVAKFAHMSPATACFCVSAIDNCKNPGDANKNEAAPRSDARSGAKPCRRAIGAPTTRRACWGRNLGSRRPTEVCWSGGRHLPHPTGRHAAPPAPCSVTLRHWPTPAPTTAISSMDAPNLADLGRIENGPTCRAYGCHDRAPRLEPSGALFPQTRLSISTVASPCEASRFSSARISLKPPSDLG
ncbi:hypothetical protein EDB80DRAFT_683619 [Ilyonectria destructans]|nr:hypothetical protein EDB80DRAFT_683619 [Ilyonectria destructans]